MFLNIDRALTQSFIVSQECYGSSRQVVALEVLWYYIKLLGRAGDMESLMSGYPCCLRTLQIRYIYKILEIKHVRP
jgi:hypothetical protein